MIYIWYLIVIDQSNPQKNILIKKPFYFIAVLHIQVDRQVLQQWENVSKKLFIKMFWFVFINLTNNVFLLFPILPKRTEEAAQSKRLEEI